MLTEKEDDRNSWTCPNVETQYDQLASLFFNTEKGIIKNLFSKPSVEDYTTPNLLVFGLAWFGFTITTYGVWIPAGLFLPGIIMGGALGRLYTNIIQYIFNYTDENEA